MTDLGKVLLGTGILFAVAGLLLLSGFGRGWLGQLPGDIRGSLGNTRVFFPITTCLLISVVVSIVLAWLRR